MQNILRKIQIIMCKSSSHIIIGLMSHLSHLLELIYDQIITSFAIAGWSHKVMYFFSTIDAQYNIRHLFVGKFHYLICQQHAVRCQCKTELLIKLFLFASAICNQILHNLKIHQRLSTKEIYFQIHPVTGIRNQKI